MLKKEQLVQGCLGAGHSYTKRGTRITQQFVILVLMVLASSCVWGAVTFNNALPMTTNAIFPASEDTGSKGGLILFIDGDPGGGSIDLQHRPFSLSEEAGTPIWLPVALCSSITTLPSECRVSLGPNIDIRLEITGGTALSIVARGWIRDVVMVGVELGGGGGGASWNTITGGTSTEAFIVDGTMTATATGSIHATGLTQSSNDADATMLALSTPSIGFFARPTSTQAHFEFDGPLQSSDGYIWHDDSAGTWSGLNLAVGTANRWIITRAGGFFRHEDNVGMTSSRSIDTASFRPHTSFDVGIGGDSGTSGSLVHGTAIATWTAAGLDITDGLLFKHPVASSAPGSPVLGDAYYDNTNNTLCIFTGAGFVQTDDYTTACI